MAKNGTPKPPQLSPILGAHAPPSADLAVHFLKRNGENHQVSSPSSKKITWASSNLVRIERTPATDEDVSSKMDQQIPEIKAKAPSKQRSKLNNEPLFNL